MPYPFLKILLLIFGLAFVMDMTVYLILKRKIKDNLKLSGMMGRIAFEYALYVISALVFSIWGFLNAGLKQGFIMLLFAFSPFITGYFATYKTKNVFTCFQFLVIILSIVYGFIGF